MPAGSLAGSGGTVRPVCLHGVLLLDELAQVRTKKKEFLERIEWDILWGDGRATYKGERGNKPYELNLMLRLHILQNL